MLGEKSEPSGEKRSVNFTCKRRNDLEEVKLCPEVRFSLKVPKQPRRRNGFLLLNLKICRT